MLLLCSLSLPTLAAEFPADFGVHKVTIDPGHGAPGNPGNENCTCAEEEDEMLRVAVELRDHLVATGHFDVHMAREGEATPEYWPRVNAAAAYGSEAFLSLHSDTRAQATEVDGCSTNTEHPGFSVLYSDEPEDRERRAGLGRAVSDAMAAQGFTPYSGADYGQAYDADPTAGVFIDRRGLLMLRRPTMPSVIIETHHAWAPDEVAAWQTTETLDRFEEAVTVALIAFLTVDEASTAEAPHPPPPPDP
ncbi:MAG: N-acetylmuramoyl-L-alanine amidase [Proteobacteria bacterium]|nr:N-acetylmuramoyl-L-alanine amidase [Pseudomonadota bacterium]MCP4915914.1 N-acetylmuramoyl-L-alanine amidase [Pseudomonadota bacterium]